jgi:hypothetical protein
MHSSEEKRLLPMDCELLAVYCDTPQTLIYSGEAGVCFAHRCAHSLRVSGHVAPLPAGFILRDALARSVRPQIDY